MEYLFIYGLNLLGNFEIIIRFIAFMAIVSCVIFFAYLIANYQDINSKDSYYEDKRITYKKSKSLLIKFVAIAILLLFLPSKQTVLLIGGVYYGKKAVNAVVTSDKLEKVNTIIDLQLDNYIKELKNE